MTAQKVCAGLALTCTAWLMILSVGVLITIGASLLMLAIDRSLYGSS